MSRWFHTLAVVLVVAAAATVTSFAPARAADDVDGPNDCLRTPQDFGDAPEGGPAYPGIPAAFPTCLFPGPVGTQNLTCPPISSPPGPTGFVRNFTPAGAPPYWLGCQPAAPAGIDSEADGKSNSTGGAISACNDIPVDCVEAAFGMNFGQDECYGGMDAGIAAPLHFTPCALDSFTFITSNCSQTVRQVYLNVLVDMNEDGDWNDNFPCNTQCAYEWAIKNRLIVLPVGCGTLNTHGFLVGPRSQRGYGWLRITLSDQPVTDDFPWAGSASMANASLQGGETEDYPVLIDTPVDPCGTYDDFGDAPEGVDAYPGAVMGHFPTCTAATVSAGVADTVCTSNGLTPGPADQAGYVKHVSVDGDPFKVWFGCSATGAPSVDSEGDGKMNATGGPASVCASAINVDCVQTAFGGVMQFGQDECYGDADAGLAAALTFNACSLETLAIKAFNCRTQSDAQGYLNVLVDWNGDGDWNDNFLCAGQCTYEWAVKNQPVTLLPGCNTLQPTFTTGPNAGNGWMRITITPSPVTNDFPWAGSAGQVGGVFRGGETEDYPVTIVGTQDPCASYTDFGDAPEGIDAYPGAVAGHFPTCLAGATSAGIADTTCTAISVVPFAGTQAGYVKHVSSPNDPPKFWLGCATVAPSVDGEADGKVNLTGAGASACATAVTVDCSQSAFGGAMTFGQDECYGDADAGILSPVTFTSCTAQQVPIQAFNCRTTEVRVFLNVLVDWNGDGDWNDNFICAGQCVYEWAVKNLVYTLTPGCNTLTPTINAGPNGGYGWMRVTVTAAPVDNVFPFAGSASMPGGVFQGGETEDYPVRINPQDPCVAAYLDFGDAPEGDLFPAYSSGVIGRFPTCIAPGPVGTQDVLCGTPLSSPPGPTGYVVHSVPASAPVKVWLGCGISGTPALGRDSELNGKVNRNPPFGTASACDPAVTVDSFEPAWFSFGQDESYGTPDAAIASPLQFRACVDTVVRLTVWLCSQQPADAYFNVLVDWNGDGDWNDMVPCSKVGWCRPEWTVKNRVWNLTPGCNVIQVPVSPAEKIGQAWMRVTVTLAPVLNDFPWNGSVGEPNGAYFSGETEDYPVVITPSLVDVEPAPPLALQFAPPMPNPARAGTLLRFALPHESDVSLVAYDVAGRAVRVIADRRMPAGEQRMTWDFRDDQGHAVPAGLYLVKLRVGADVITRQVIRIE